MRIDFYLSPKEANAFEASCAAVIRNVDKATKVATTKACKDILEESLRQVPRATGALASTGFYEVVRNRSTKRYTYMGIIGYAGMSGAGASHDRYNETSRANVSSYAYKVHEDLTSLHLNGGKAKFLEDPVREYGQRHFKRVAESHWKMAIDSSGKSAKPVKE